MFFDSRVKEITTIFVFHLQSKIAMLEMKAKMALVTKVNKETNTVETGSTARVVVAQDVMQDKNVKEALFNLNTKITRLQV